MDVFMAALRKMFANEPSVTIETIHKWVIALQLSHRSNH